MTRTFRFVPPEPRPDSLTRPRLLRELVGRWEHRVTSVVGGPGLGKTTLLAQAIAENRLAPRGDDVWIGLERQDSDADGLARVVAAALSPTRSDDDGDPVARADVSIDPATVADAVWNRSPIEACVVLDDLHLLPPTSTGAAWLREFVEALPANGHLVLASRSYPPLPLSRIGTQGDVLWLDEDDLRFSDDELTGFAARRGLDRERFDGTGGWPAMAELVASVDRRFTGTYLWEEVLEPLGTLRRHILAVLCDLGGADDELASAAVGTSVDLADALDGVPLVARGSDGWFVPHGLWRETPGLAVAEAERTEIRRRAVEHLTARRRFEESFALVQETELWEVAPTVLRAASIGNDRVFSGQLGRWLAQCPESVRRSPEGLLAAGVDASDATPASAREPLEKAMEQFRALGDLEGELEATAHLGRLAWWWLDRPLLEQIAPRVFELAAAGKPKALAMATFGYALAADMWGEDSLVLDHLDRYEPGHLAPVWDVLARWNEGVVRLYAGDAEAAAEIVEDIAKTIDPAMTYLVEFLGELVHWAQGHVDDVVARLDHHVAAVRATGVPYNIHQGLCFISFSHTLTGNAAAGRACVEEAIEAADPTDGPMPVLTAVSLASVLLAEGDEAGATALLAEAMDNHGVNQGIDRRWWRQMLSLSYVLLPEARPVWDDAALRGHVATARDLSQLVVAVRNGDASRLLRAVQLPSVDMIRAWLHYRFAAELAVGLASVGRSEGRALLDALGPAGRNAVRDLPTTQPALARHAKSLLAAVPAPPPQSTYLRVLGPFVVQRDGPDGEEIADNDLRRQRVQELLAYLIGHRRTNRATIMAALWPDLDERAAGNNLGVTLNHLLRVLEPWRGSGEPAFLLRLEGHAVQLVTGHHLQLDVDDFDVHLATAASAEADGTPSLALDHLLAAVGLYRDHLFLDLPETDWFALDREHYRTRFVAAAVRAGQLLLGRGDTDHAQAVAHRALAVDQWSEDAYGVLVGAGLVRGDRSGARRLLDRCTAALDDLGVGPSEATQRLRRRVHGIASD